MQNQEIINCLCSNSNEDGLMLQCELCLCWQHGNCNGISKDSDVPDKYVCYICRNPQGGRESMRFKHDQDWLFEGKLPVANYHIANPALSARFEFLKASHELTGELTELKQFMHSLRVKINIANNREHPKLYLWAKKWDEEPVARPYIKNEPLDEDMTSLDVKVPIIPQPEAIKNEPLDEDMKPLDVKVPIIPQPEAIKSEPLDEDMKPLDVKVPNIPQPEAIKNEPLDEDMKPLDVKVPIIPLPEAPIDPVECQQRLLEHIKVQQNLVMNRLSAIEVEIDVLEKQDPLPKTEDADLAIPEEMLDIFIKELETLKDIAKINTKRSPKKQLKRLTNPDRIY